ncbi:MAG: thioesterase family protein [Pseudomonadota bacterium]
MTPDEMLDEAAPILTSAQTVLPEWIDYNGHMNVAYYTLAFDRALDEVYDRLGIGPNLIETHGMGPMALQTQIHYLAELLEGERFHAEFILLDADHKRIHAFMTMIAERTGQPCATYETLSMNVDLAARRGADYPAVAAATVARLVERHRAVARPPQAGATLAIRRR